MGNAEETEKRSKKPLVWNQESYRVFEQMKQALPSAAGLHLMHLAQGLLRMDPSDYGIGAVWQQLLDNGSRMPVALWSRVQAKGQRRTCTLREKEAHAIAMALRKWAGYIALHLIRVCTNHQSLRSCHKEHVDNSAGPVSRSGRWGETLGKFDFTVVYVPARDNTVADCLSGWAYFACQSMTDMCANGNQAESLEAKEMIDRVCMMQEERIKCLVVVALDAPFGKGVSRVLCFLARGRTESNKHVFRESCLQDSSSGRGRLPRGTVS